MRGNIGEGSAPVRNNNTSEQDLQSELRTTFTSNILRFANMNLQERPFETKVNCQIPSETIEAINLLIESLVSSNAVPCASLWDVNVIVYSAAVTLIQRHGRLKPRGSHGKLREPPWKALLQDQINSVRRKISHIKCVLECQSKGHFTTKQKKVSIKVQRLYRTLKRPHLENQVALLTHDLKTLNLRFKDKCTKANRDRLNNTFRTNQKQIYRTWRGEENMVSNPPSESDISKFWAGVWQNPAPINCNTEWHRSLTEKYCTDTSSKDYVITMSNLSRALLRMPNNKAPGTDMIVSYWIKKLSSVHANLLAQLQLIFSAKSAIPEWLATSRTILIPKNRETHLPNNYRPIACQNTIYKAYTSILNEFLQDHCASNNILAIEQAGGRKGSWGCTDHLLINKMVLDEVRTHKRNLFCMWFDYKKAYDSVSHQWMSESLRLAKVPNALLLAIEELTRVWATKAYLHAENQSFETTTIKYHNGILQGDCLSMLLFMLTINPLSFLLNDIQCGYKAGKPSSRNLKITHLLFVDDLKTYAGNQTQALAQLDLITRYTADIGMKFGSEKCAYLNIINGKVTSLGDKIQMNGLQLSELPKDDPYKYLGIDEDVRYRGEITKQRVRTEYIARVRKIWNSELYGRNKAQAHNIFAVPVLTPTFAILDWSKEEIHDLDVLTRKQLTMSGSFHRNGDVDRLYVCRKEGGRGLKSVYDAYICRMISVADHINDAAKTNPLLDRVREHENGRMLLASSLLRDALNITQQAEPERLSSRVAEAIHANHLKSWLEKPAHGYIMKKQRSSSDYSSIDSNLWLTSHSIPSHIEGYFCAIQEQEIDTRHLQRRRAKSTTPLDSRCRHCRVQEEDICHIIGSCSRLCSSMYLPFRHDQVAKLVYTEILRLQDPAIEIKPPEQVCTIGSTEVWWDRKIPCTPSVKFNRPDMVVWDRARKQATIIEIGIPLDVNVEETERTKRDKYMPLAIGLKRVYPEYTFQCIPIVVGATGLVTSSTKENLRAIGFNEKVTTRLISGIVKKVVYGTVKVAKSALSIRE
jgi:Reverse transcriptase (RNA-dependent DNA polymerase)